MCVPIQPFLTYRNIRVIDGQLNQPVLRVVACCKFHLKHGPAYMHAYSQSSTVS